MYVETVKVPVRAVTTGPGHYFFGYYDKCPWDLTGRYLLSLQVKFKDRPPRPGDQARIGVVDLCAGDKWIPIAETMLGVGNRVACFNGWEINPNLPLSITIIRTVGLCR